MKKPFPKLKSDKELTKFFDETDLGDYLEEKDLRVTTIRLKKQDRSVTIRLSSDLVGLLKKAAKRYHTKYQKLVRSILEENITSYLR